MLEITSYFNTLWTQPWVSDPVFGSRWVREHAITAELSNASWTHYSWMHPPFSHFLKHSQDSTDAAHPLWHPLDCHLRHEPYIALQPTICALQAKGGLCISRITISALTAQHAFLQTLSEVCRYERYFLNNISISYILKKKWIFSQPTYSKPKEMLCTLWGYKGAQTEQWNWGGKAKQQWEGAAPCRAGAESK